MNPDFHRFDPYQYLVDMSQQVESLTVQHNRLAMYCDQLEGRMLKVELDNRRLRDALIQIQFQSK